MKTMRPLLIVVLALTFFSTSKTFAGPGPGNPPFIEHRSWDESPYSFNHDLNLLPLYRDAERDAERYRVNNDRMFWDDRNDQYHVPAPPASGGGASAPLDGGISLLLAAGIGLGLKKAARKNKSSHVEETVISSADDQI